MKLFSWLFGRKDSSFDFLKKCYKEQWDAIKPINKQNYSQNWEVPKSYWGLKILNSRGYQFEIWKDSEWVDYVIDYVINDETFFPDINQIRIKPKIECREFLSRSDLLPYLLKPIQNGNGSIDVLLGAYIDSGSDRFKIKGSLSSYTPDQLLSHWTFIHNGNPVGREYKKLFNICPACLGTRLDWLNVYANIACASCKGEGVL